MSKKIEKNQLTQPARRKQVTGKRANNGGARKGSGRKTGAATKKTREIADKLAADGGFMPLNYLLEVMRTTDEDLKRQYEAGDINAIEYETKLKMQIQRRDKAAVDSCSFLHPRLSAVSAEVKLSGQDRWAAILAEN
jgi:hypothetical protein